MLMSKRKYDFLLDRYERSASRTDLPERQLTDLNSTLKRNGSPYRCVPECREAAMAPSSSGREPTWQTLERPAFIDRWISGLFPALARQISIQGWREILDICSAGHAYGMSHHQSQGETR